MTFTNEINLSNHDQTHYRTTIIGGVLMNVLSLFDGMSCGQQALQRAGISIEKYYASEIDKYAIQVTQHNFPDTIQIGDVTKVSAKDLPEIFLLLGGSPCQSFSFAGKRKGMSTKCETEILTLEHYLELKAEGYEFEGQSYLFWEFMRLLHETKPKYFLLENVIMGEKWEKVLSKAIGVNAIEINSALVSAQNRRRLYWTNIGLAPAGLFGDLESIIKQPKDKGILLKNILETDVPDKYFLSEKMINYLNTRKANYNAGKINYKTGDDVASCINASSGHLDISDNIIVDTNRKARCFTAGGNSGGLHSQMDLIKCAAMRGRNPENPKSREVGLETEQQLEPREDGKTNCLTTVAKDNYVVFGGGYEQDNRAYFEEGKGGTLDIKPMRQKVQLNTSQIRRLTPVECERLQTVKDNYTEIVSDTQRFKMLGNGWTVDVIAHIFSFLNIK